MINTLVAKNNVHAGIAEGAKISAGYALDGAGDPTTTVASPESDVIVESDDDTHIVNCAGALALSGGSAGVGATIVSIIFFKNVTAEITSALKIQSARNIDITANSKDNLWLLAIAFGAGNSAGVAGDVNVLIFSSVTTAKLGGTMIVAGGSIRVLANSDSLLVNVGAGIAVGGTAGVVAVAIVTYFYNQTYAMITGGNLTAGGDIDISASFQGICYRRRRRCWSRRYGGRWRDV